MAIWIPITIIAAFLQNARSALQKKLKSALGPAGGGIGATFARFGFAVPFTASFLSLALLFEPLGAPTPSPGADFALWVIAAASAQIGATWALLRSFDFANFAVGTALSKTEPLIAAALGAIALSEFPSALSWLGIAIGVFGVGAATLRPAALAGDGAGRDLGRAVFWGIGSAVLFGGSAVGYRAASLSLDAGSVPLRATLTLFCATLFQAFAMGLWMRAARRSAWDATLRAWRPGLWIGAAGAGASACWFMAMTLEPAAHVRTLAQVELIFTIAASILVFKERPSLREIAGVVLIGIGCALLILGALGA